MHRLFAIPAALAAVAVALSFWGWMGWPVAVVDAPSPRMHCLSYTPYDGGSAPIDRGYDVSEARIEADLKALSSMTGCIRTYSSRGPQGAVIRIADSLGYKVHLGVWANANPVDTADEIAQAVALAKAYPKTVISLVVGNEVMLRREMTAQRLADYIREVREKSGIPVTYADIYEFWRVNPILADAVDFMMVHILPYWDDPEPVSIDAVQPHVKGIVKTIQDTFPGRPMIIGEIGWPSAGRTRGAAVPGLVNEARFLREFMNEIGTVGMDYNIIEAVDQGWKRRPEGTVGGYWGVFDKHRQQKFPLTGPVSEWPRWQECLLATLGIALLVLLWGLMPGRRLTPLSWIGLGVTGAVLGATFVLQAHQAETSSVYVTDWIKGGFFAVLTLAAFRLLVLPVFTAGESHRPLGPPASIDAVLAWLRRPSPTAYTPEIGLGLLAWAVLIASAVMAVVLAIDGRHRDFPLAGLWLPAAAFILHRLKGADSRAWIRGRREEGWLALVIVALAPFSWDGVQNVEAMAWIVLAVALATPWLGAMRRVLRSPSVEPGGA